MSVYDVRKRDDAEVIAVQQWRRKTRRVDLSIQIGTRVRQGDGVFRRPPAVANTAGLSDEALPALESELAGLKEFHADLCEAALRYIVEDGARNGSDPTGGGEAGGAAGDRSDLGESRGCGAERGGAIAVATVPRGCASGARNAFPAGVGADKAVDRDGAAGAVLQACFVRRVHQQAAMMKAALR